ncbi:Uncharacterized protein MSYG_3487 [Malassezia sympodialis ATCC 42132]|uniref:NADH dehydrogenase [ubiquinone] iron-sulfur protein 5 n=1 Tax=Malassezia sympodialis (strain ATCC 42132) TaxID=1230383 RepID=A0A1M8A9P6_MALS4|nr:Uncharacterized protein MSYG_3487 [Malassezia sympodialis ATCC 42132]
MASGFGIKGGPSRCFAFWQDFRKCYLTADEPSECSLQKEDYLECLHHTKELERAHMIQRRMIEVQHEESKRARETVRQDQSQGLRLGLIDPNAESPAEPEAPKA